MDKQHGIAQAAAHGEKKKRRRERRKKNSKRKAAMEWVNLYSVKLEEGWGVDAG